MDYKYIEQLLERYWECATSPAEEAILKAFFTQVDIPEELRKYRPLFVYEQQQQTLGLGEEFDKRILALTGQDEEQEVAGKRAVKVRQITLASRLRPLYRAAAAVAIVALLGNAAQHSFKADSASDPAMTGSADYTNSAYQAPGTDRQQVPEAGSQTLETFEEGPQVAINDSTRSRQPADSHPVVKE